MNDWIVLFVIYITIFISSPFIAVFHELGHAFAFLAFTRPSKIDIYIGSYGDHKNNIEFRTGRLNFYIKRSFPFVKGIGVCISSKQEPNYLKYILIMLAGAVFTCFAAGVILLIAIHSDAGVLVKIACYIFLGFSVISLLTNLVPRDIGSEYKGLQTDGRKILLALRIKNKLGNFQEAVRGINEKNYDAAIKNLKIVLETAPGNKHILQLLIVASLETKQFNEASQAISELEKITELQPDALFYKGCLQSIANQHDEAIETYSAVLKKNRNHILALTNIGHELIEKGAHQVAKRALDRAIKQNPKFDMPYANLGYSKMIQGELEEGKTLIDKCLDLNKENATAYKAMGVYYLKLKDAKQSAVNFMKAVELDKDIDISVYENQLKLLETPA